MPNPLKKIDLLSMAAVALVLLAVLLSAAEPSAAFLGLFSNTTTLTPDNDVVRIPVADMADGKAHFYAVAAGEKQIRFFAVKTPDGRMRTAFDACDVCFPEKKGYRQEGEFMLCANCGRRFHLTMVGDVHGGCNPAPLAAAIAGDMLQIGMADLAAGGRFF